jgi:class 3 adenylate cyclase
MDPQVQYCETDDGVSIAYWAAGEGHPLLFMPPVPFSQLQLEWQIPEWRAFYERLVERYRVIRYDPRGYGLSDREVQAETFDAHLSDLEAVVEHLGLDRFAIFAIAHSGSVAACYAATFPTRVSHLVFWCCYNRNEPPPADRDWEPPLLRSNHRLYTDTIATRCAGPDEWRAARHLANLVRDGAAPEALAAHLRVFREVNADGWLAKLRTPALVMHRRSLSVMDPSAGRRLAQRIPGARFAMFEGTSIAPFIGEVEPVLATMGDFLPVRSGSGAEERTPGGLRTILFTDLEGHTAMMSRLGDTDGRGVLREVERITREALAAHGGTEVKSLGDGFLASFVSAQRALECAISLQRAVAASVDLSPAAVRLRVGINAGEPIEEEDDLFGASVIAAARIASRATGGQILISDVVRQLVAGKGFLVSDQGEYGLKGLDEPVRVWELRWSGRDE